MIMKINYIHERALRLVYIDYRSSFDEILRKDKSISIHHRNIHSVAIEMFKVKHKLSPPLMTEIFEQSSNGVPPEWVINLPGLRLKRYTWRKTP